MKLGLLLQAEIDRLDSVAHALGRSSAIGPDNLLEQIPYIEKFNEDYHRAYSNYLEAVLPQQERNITCAASCGNCCHHFPMSVEPFELVALYLQLRKRSDFIEIMEGCENRTKIFDSLFKKNYEQLCSEDESEDKSLHDYFSLWKPCMFSDHAGDCLIYPMRPVSCRMYFSQTSPAYCTPEYLQTEKNESYIVYMPDSIEETLLSISAHYAMLDLPESFFGGLLCMNSFEGLLG